MANSLAWEGLRTPAAQPSGDEAVQASAGNITATPVVSARLVEMMCAVRKDRLEQFPGPLGSDSCWDILLTLYAAHLNQHRLTITKVKEQTAVPSTTALRLIAALGSAGLVTRTKDRLDGRRIFVELSPAGVAALNRYFLRTGLRTAFV
jgi:hypothetical protein